MDRDTFLRTAPYYYALAIAVYFEKNESSQVRDIIEDYSYEEERDFGVVIVKSRMRESFVFEKGLMILAQHNLVEIVSDDFGPPIIIKGTEFDDGWDLLSRDINLPFSKYKRLGKSGKGWLLAALDKVNETREELGIADEDFVEVETEWEPLPLDRNSDEVENAIVALGDTIEKVEQDNGYAANLPEERSFVIGALKQTLSRLKTDTQISLAYLRRNAFDPLLTLTRRFAGNAIEAAAKNAADALIQILGQETRKMVVEALKALFGL